MKINKKLNGALTRNQIISSIVWAIVIIACAYNSESGNKQITYILLSGFFIEFLRISSFNKSIKKNNEDKSN